MAPRKKTDEVLASARKDLKAQLALVREEKARLDGEERALTQALAGMDGRRAARASARSSASAGDSKPSGAKPATRKSSARRGRRRPSASKSTADRVRELRGLLGEGPQSRGDLADALKVSPARVQQLLGELGSAVSSQSHPDNRRVKLWVLKGTTNGAGSAKSTGKRGKAKRPSTRKSAPSEAAAK